MINTASACFAAVFLAMFPVGAESAGNIQLCVKSCNYRSSDALIRAEVIASRIFATAGVTPEWHSAGTAACRGVRQARSIMVDFADEARPSDHPGAMAYARPYEGSHIVVLFDRVEHSSDGPTQLSNVLAHVMVHEITHLLQGIARHSATGLMKAHWTEKDLSLMAWSPLAFAPEDIELIEIGMAHRVPATAPLLGVRSVGRDR
jgi:hypothetical protein